MLWLLALLVLITVSLAALIRAANRRLDDRLASLAVPSEQSREKPRQIDDTTQVSVYRPGNLAAGHWYDVLAFIYRSESEPHAGGAQERWDTECAVEKMASDRLRERAGEYGRLVQDMPGRVPRRGEITFVPIVKGCDFNPPKRSFLWCEPVHCESFRVRANEEAAGTTVLGSMAVFCNHILMTEVPITLRVRESGADAPTEALASTGRRGAFRKIFLSYSHDDANVASLVKRFVSSLGDRYSQDVEDLRSGEVWCERISKLIDEADVFQLFWSRQSMRSQYVRAEWEHALSLRRPTFIRPCYWEEPFPEDAASGLPPHELAQLHFYKLPLHAPLPAEQPALDVPLPAAERSSPRWFGPAARLGISSTIASVVFALSVLAGGIVVAIVNIRPAGTDDPRAGGSNQYESGLNGRLPACRTQEDCRLPMECRKFQDSDFGFCGLPDCVTSRDCAPAAACMNGTCVSSSADASDVKWVSASCGNARLHFWHGSPVNQNMTTETLILRCARLLPLESASSGAVIAWNGLGMTVRIYRDPVCADAPKVLPTSHPAYQCLKYALEPFASRDRIAHVHCAASLRLIGCNNEEDKTQPPPP